MPVLFAPDPGILSLLSIGVSTGSIAATLATDSTLLSIRWGNTTRLMVPDIIQVGVSVNAVITTSVAIPIGLFIARSFTASDSGGTAITLTGDNNVFRTAFDASLVTDARIAATAGLTTGTRTLDAQPFAVLPVVTGTAIGVAREMTTMYIRSALFPIVLAQNEGLVLRNMAAGPATGTFLVHVQMRWLETVTELII